MRPGCIALHAKEHVLLLWEVPLHLLLHLHLQEHLFLLWEVPVPRLVPSESEWGETAEVSIFIYISITYINIYICTREASGAKGTLRLHLHSQSHTHSHFEHLHSPAVLTQGPSPSNLLPTRNGRSIFDESLGANVNAHVHACKWQIEHQLDCAADDAVTIDDAVTRTAPT